MPFLRDVIDDVFDLKIIPNEIGLLIRQYAHVCKSRLHRIDIQTFAKLKTTIRKYPRFFKSPKTVIQVYNNLSPRYRKGYVNSLSSCDCLHPKTLLWIRHNWSGLIHSIANNKASSKEGVNHFMNIMFDSCPISVKAAQLVTQINEYLITLDDNYS
jgi:hypothetical protein